MAVVSAIAVAVGCATMCSRKASKNLAEGDPAPDFTLQDSAGTPVTLSSFRGKKCVVLYFYPKDGTPGCTAQACSFRDSYEEFTDLGAEVIGVSSDSAQSHSGPWDAPPTA